MNYDYLEHHGILGQKWGVRRYQNPDGTYTNVGLRRKRSIEKSEEKASKAKTRIGKNYHNYNAVSKRYEYERANRVKNAKGLGNKYSEAFGYRNSKAVFEANAELARRRGETARTKIGKARESAREFNNKSMAEYSDKMSKASTGKKIFESAIYRSELMSVPVQTITGRQSTVGKEILMRAFTGGLGNMALDAAQVGKNVHNASVERKEEKQEAKAEKTKAANENKAAKIEAKANRNQTMANLNNAALDKHYNPVVDAMYKSNAKYYSKRADKLNNKANKIRNK